MQEPAFAGIVLTTNHATIWMWPPNATTEPWSRAISASCGELWAEGGSDRTETVQVSEGRRTNELALVGILGSKAAWPAMDATLLIADSDVRRRGELRRFFSSSGLLVAAVSNGLECLAEFAALEPDVLVIAMDIPWGGGDGVISRLNDRLPIGRKPLILVIGETPAETLSARTGVAPCNCFSKRFRKEDLLDRIGMEFAVRLLRSAENRQRPPEESMRRTCLRWASDDCFDSRERRIDPACEGAQLLHPSDDFPGGPRGCLGSVPSRGRLRRRRGP